MNPCPICNGTLHEPTLATIDIDWPWWLCDGCGRTFNRCFHCDAVTACREGSMRVCYAPTCPARDVPRIACPRCGRNSTEPPGTIDTTFTCTNPACPPTIHSPARTWPPAPTPAATPDLGILGPSYFETRYEERALLARGGIAEVVLAFDRVMRREVAVKRARPEARIEGIRSRFVREARIAGRLTHPNLLPVHDLGIDEAGRVYFTMRLADGPTFARHFDESATPAWCLSAFRDVCRAIEYAHGEGVLHLDLKPQNVLTARTGEVFVVDWGLARAEGEADDRDPDPEIGTPIGTPAYMAPEQAAGALSAVGPATDVYGLGGVLYFALYGTPPNHGRSFIDSLVTSAKPKQPGTPRSGMRSADPALFDRLATVCLRCLHPDPAIRFARVTDILAALP